MLHLRVLRAPWVHVLRLTFHRFNSHKPFLVASPKSRVDMLLKPGELEALDVAGLCSFLSLAAAAQGGVRLPWARLAACLSAFPTTMYGTREISSLLRELRASSRAPADVRAFLTALAPKVTGSTQAFGSQAVGEALYGLRGCSSEHAETRAVLSAMAPKVAGCTESL